MQYSRKQNILLTMKIFLLVCGCVFFGKMTRTLKSIPWVSKLTGHVPPVADVNFMMVNPSVQPLLPAEEIFLLVLVSSVPGSDYRFARNAIRETWGISLDCRSTNDPCPWNVVFLLGRSYQDTLDSQIMEEARAFNDILVGNFNDTYINLVIKLFMGFSWASKVNCRFILKADDDIYVRLPKLASWLHHAPSSRLYAGHVHSNVGVSRDPDERNPLPPGSSFNEKYYPPYCLGAFYVLSRSIIPHMLKAVQRWRPWPIEDTYIGVLARDVGVSPIDIYGFVLKARASRNLPQFTDCYWDCITALGHRLTPTHLHLVHNKFQNLLSFNSSTCAVNTCGEENGSRSLCVGYIVIFIAAILLAAFAYLRTRKLTLNMQWFCERINI